MYIALVYIINIGILTTISFWCYRRYSHSALKPHYWPALIFKTTCGFLLGHLFYIHYGDGDTILYYEKACDLSSMDFGLFLKAVTAGTVPSEPVRAIYFVRLVAAILWITHADYWLLSAYFSLFSFLGCAYLSEKLISWKNEFSTAAMVAFLYLPSVVFWSSGLLKESLVFGSMAFLLGVYFSWYQKGKLSIGNCIMGTMAFGVIVFIKYYIAAVLTPALVYLTLYHLPLWDKKRIFGLWRKTSLLIPILLLPTIFFLTWLSPNLSYSELWRVMQWNHQEYIRLAPEGALRTLTWFGSTWDMVFNIPYLWFSGIFRPLPGEDLTFPAIFSSLENATLLLASFLAVCIFWKKKTHWTPELLAVLIYISLLSVFLSYAAPNFGTLARFKIYYTPFVALLAVYQLGATNIFRKD